MLKELKDSIKNKDYNKVLRLYLIKDLLSIAAKLFNKDKKGLEDYICRVLLHETGSSLLIALKKVLPSIKLQS